MKTAFVNNHINSVNASSGNLSSVKSNTQADDSIIENQFTGDLSSLNRSKPANRFREKVHTACTLPVVPEYEPLYVSSTHAPESNRQVSRSAESAHLESPMNQLLDSIAELSGNADQSSSCDKIIDAVSFGLCMPRAEARRGNLESAIASIKLRVDELAAMHDLSDSSTDPQLNEALDKLVENCTPIQLDVIINQISQAKVDNTRHSYWHSSGAQGADSLNKDKYYKLSGQLLTALTFKSVALTSYR